jgi:hypothetical protein
MRDQHQRCERVYKIAGTTIPVFSVELFVAYCCGFCLEDIRAVSIADDDGGILWNSEYEYNAASFDAYVPT